MLGVGDTYAMRISAKTDYAVRACLELASQKGDGFVKAEVIAEAQGIPSAFVLGILGELKRSSLVESRRGLEGGFRLARPSDKVSIADVIRAVDGPLASVGGVKMEDVEYDGSATYLRHIWVALRTAMRTVLEETTLADAASGNLPAGVNDLLANEGAWVTRPNRLEVVLERKG